MTTKRYAIVPSFNKTTRLLRGPPISLGQKIAFGPISNEQFGILAKSPPELASIVRSDHRSIFIDIDDSVKDADVADNVASFVVQSNYLLNHFRSAAPISCRYAFVIGRSGKQRVLSTHSLELSYYEGSAATSNYKITGTREEIRKFAEVIEKACKAHPPLLLTLGRFNSSLLRAHPIDRIIDLTISLESLVQDGKNELAFKFSLFNSFSATADSNKRMASFRLLQSLYQARSAIVHGAGENSYAKNLKQVQDNWSDIEVVARSAINYHIFHMATAKPADWIPHLKALVIANAPRVF